MLIKWFSNNRVAANFLMLIIIVGGLLSLPDLKKEVIPNAALNMIQINITYPGAAPKEVEQSICMRLEEAIFNLSGVNELITRAKEGQCDALIKVAAGFNPRFLQDAIRSRVEAINDFPGEAERAVITEMFIRTPVISVVIYGENNEKTLKKFLRKTQFELQNLPSVSQVEINNVKPYEISIEISDAALRLHDLTFPEVAEAIRSNSIDLAGGMINSPNGNIALKTQGQAYTGKEFELIPIRAVKDGSYLQVNDIATVVDEFKQSDRESYYNGYKAGLLTVYRVGNQNILSLSNEVKEYVKKANHDLPSGIGVEIWQDHAQMFTSRLELLTKSALMGLTLVLIILVVFLRWRVAIWVSMGIVVSFMGTLFLLVILGQSINMISMFAFILVLGIVVDDAIIVGESIFTQQRKGVTGITGAIAGTLAVAKPVTISALTTMLAFSPILFLPGISGSLWSIIAIVVIATLAFSLIESLLILPTHLSSSATPHNNTKRPFSRLTRLQERFVTQSEQFVSETYKSILAVILRWRYATIALAFTVFVISVALVAGGRLPLVFFPQMEGDMIVASVKLPSDSTLDQTQKVLDILESAARTLQQSLQNQDGVIRATLTTLGAQPQGGGAGTESISNIGEVALELIPTDSRHLSGSEIIQRWRDSAGTLPFNAEVTFSSTLDPKISDIALILSGRDPEQLQQAAKQLKEHLRTYPSIYNIKDSMEDKMSEVRVQLKPYANNLGLDTTSLARQVRQAFYGEEVQSILRGSEEVKVFVRYTAEERQSLYTLENMTIRLNNGDNVPIAAVADFIYGYTPKEIRRIDGERVITVSGYVDHAITTPNHVMHTLDEHFWADFEYRYPDIKRHLSGSQEEQSNIIAALIKGLFLAVLAIYGLIAVSFRSYSQPLIILAAIPMGFVGAVAGHFLLDLQLSVLSLCGVIAVAGVVVNDNLVLVEYINRAREKGSDLFEAVSQAGIARFRPIILTSVTTFFGLLPLMLERSTQAQFLVPMAASLAFGVLFATIVTLLAVPAAYLILEDLKKLIALLIKRSRQEAAI